MCIKTDTKSARARRGIKRAARGCKKRTRWRNIITPRPLAIHAPSNRIRDWLCHINVDTIPSVAYKRRMETQQTSDFAKWFGSLRDRRAQSKIAGRIARIELGLMGDVKGYRARVVGSTPMTRARGRPGYMARQDVRWGQPSTSGRSKIQHWRVLPSPREFTLPWRTKRGSVDCLSAA